MTVKKQTKKVAAKSKVDTAVNLETKLLLSVMMGVAFSATLFSFAAFSQGLQISKSKPVAKKQAVVSTLPYEGPATRVVSADYRVADYLNIIDDWGVDTLTTSTPSSTPAETGIIFVTDLSGSMISKMPQVRSGINTAISTIFDMATSTIATSTADIALISYGSYAMIDSGFTHDIDYLQSKVNSYDANMGTTDHSAALSLTYQLLDSHNYERNIVIFMTDGESTYGPNGDCVNGYDSSNPYGRSLCITENDLKACNSDGDLCADIYTIAAPAGTTNPNGLKGFMNALSSSDCTYVNYGLTATPGMCGSNGVECYNAANQFEECDEASMNCYQCQWTANQLYSNRAYDDSAGLDMAYYYVASRLVIPPTCGDGVCNSDETCNECISDCGRCPKPGTHYYFEEAVPDGLQ